MGRVFGKGRGERQLDKRAVTILAIAMGFAVTVLAPEYSIHQSCRLNIFTLLKKGNEQD